jgi:MFS family permease
MAVLPGRVGIFVIMAMGFPTAMYNAVMPAWMSERFAEHGQGRIMGLLSTIFCVANVIVALAGGWIALLSTRWIMAFGGLAAVVSATLMLRLARAEAAR